MSKAIQVVESLVDAQARELFASCGAPLTHVPNAAALNKDAAVAGMIGFTGETMRGTLILVAPFQLIVAARPRELRSHDLSEKHSGDWLLVRDWTAELTNQLLGRVKNRLAKMGVTLRVSTPTALSGSALSVATPRSKRARSYSFRAARGSVALWWDATYDAGFALGPEVEGAPNAVREGDVVLF